MSVRRTTRLIHEGQFLVEIVIDLIEDDTTWSPYLSPADASKLDRAREALRDGRLGEAARLGKLYRLQPMPETASA